MNDCTRFFFAAGDCADWVLPGGPPDLVVTNPPWGRRLPSSSRARGGGSSGSSERPEGAGEEGGGGARAGEAEEAAAGAVGGEEEAWRSLNTFLRGQCSGGV